MPRDVEKLVQGATLIRFEMAESDPTQLCRIDYASNSCQRNWKHLLESGVHHERLIVVDEELIELDSIFGMKSGDAVNLRSDLSDICFHSYSSDVLTL